ncbi:UDP-N-acetylmuramate dehydrogenase [Halonatronum saccharophilum]|uniref:UDP-N-acetylmuramate dehydrogenase n=1 Tax=Halonatronum saccharophilum TaxID=150060 RepID=UPI000484EAB5|nr:UDP-N-acetylmuramate dehydrogenase [Halonatronum saccharophilum]
MEGVHKVAIKKLTKGEVLVDEPLKNHTYFKIGGPAAILVIPEDVGELKELITYLYQNQIPYRVIGRGSNLLINDAGLSEVVIKLTRINKKIRFAGNKVRVGAGVLLPKLALEVAKKGLSGLEFGIGIPATVGGATFMNAGIGDLRSIGDLLSRVKIIKEDGEIKWYLSEELEFSYRRSSFQGNNDIILEVELILKPGNLKEIEEEMKDLINKRKRSQPISKPNAGCIFKNPKGDSAGRLIDLAGGKGLKVGGAEVSSKHANFIINSGEATAKDVVELISKIEDLVYQKFGVKLVREVKYLD